jgi:LysM repeat protein
MSRSPARLFAPLALVACAIAILVIVAGSSSDGGGSKSSTTATGSSTTATTTTTTSKAPHKQRRFYRVKEGDVLSEISIRTGVPLERIEELNPTVDAQSLHAGQKLKLAP